jgi:DivIVA domain-containing protein
MTFMVTALIYLVVMALVAATLFFAASAAFGRAEDYPALPPGTTPTRLPADAITGDDVQSLCFQQSLRGYKASEVDWALRRLAGEIDTLRAQLARERL